MAFEVTTIQKIHEHINELNDLIVKQSDAFDPLLAELQAHASVGSAEAYAALSLQSFSMGLASHVLRLEKALIAHFADEATLREMDKGDSAV
jgi:hypothetical protein